MCSTAEAVSSFFASLQANNAAEARIDNINFFMFLKFRCINNYLVVAGAVAVAVAVAAAAAVAASTSSATFLESIISI